MSNSGDPTAGKPPPPAPPPPSERAALPSRLAGEARRRRDNTQFGVTGEIHQTISEFGQVSGAHRHQATVAYDASVPEAPPLPGVGLDEVLARGPLDAEKAMARVRALARALDERHQAGQGHGGLTPRHVRYVPDEAGDVLLLEAGALPPDPTYLARYEAPELSGAIKTRAISPPRADVYGLGAIFFELLTGEPVFQGATVAELRSRHARAAVPSARQVNPDTDLTPAVELVLQKALKKRPGDRQADSISFAAELVAANADDDRGTVHLSAEEASFLKDILEAKTQSERTRQEMEEEKRRVEQEMRRAEEETRRAEEEAAAAEAARAAANRAQQAAEKRKKTMRQLSVAALITLLAAGAAAAWFLTRDPEIITKTETVTKTVTKTEIVTKERVVEVPVVIEVGPTQPEDAGSAQPTPRRRAAPRPRPVEPKPAAPKPAPKADPSGPVVF